MEDLTGFFIVLGGLAAILAQISIWAPRKVWVKVAALVTTALFLPAAYVSLADPQIVEIIGLAGFDAAFIDMEHTNFDLALIEQMVRAADLVDHDRQAPVGRQLLACTPIREQHCCRVRWVQPLVGLTAGHRSHPQRSVLWDYCERRVDVQRPDRGRS